MKLIEHRPSFDETVGVYYDEQDRQRPILKPKEWSRTATIRLIAWIVILIGCGAFWAFLFDVLRFSLDAILTGR